jgi:hypothetical protein
MIFVLGILAGADYTATHFRTLRLCPKSQLPVHYHQFPRIPFIRTNPSCCKAERRATPSASLTQTPKIKRLRHPPRCYQKRHHGFLEAGIGFLLVAAIA